MQPVKIVRRGKSLLCPECGSRNSHATGAVEIYDTTPGEGRWSFRIPMYCENDHDFEIRVEQYKGETMLGTTEYFAPRDGVTIEHLNASELASW
jgi:hypothetical protein